MCRPAQVSIDLAASRRPVDGAGRSAGYLVDGGFVVTTRCSYTYAMTFQWDERKRINNLRKYSIDFRDAATMFAGDIVLMEDDRFEYGEIRFVSLGLLRGRVIVVVHTEHGDVTRIISARKATNYEQDIYFRGIID